jgi:hypothetical protein
MHYSGGCGLQDAVANPQLAPLSVAFLVALLQGASRFELLSGAPTGQRQQLVTLQSHHLAAINFQRNFI